MTYKTRNTCCKEINYPSLTHERKQEEPGTLKKQGFFNGKKKRIRYIHVAICRDMI